MKDLGGLLRATPVGKPVLCHFRHLFQCNHDFSLKLLGCSSDGVLELDSGSMACL
jgi:hypothetical protein